MNLVEVVSELSGDIKVLFDGESHNASVKVCSRIVTCSPLISTPRC